MGKSLDENGVLYLWNKIKEKFATKDVATQSANGLLSSTDKTKLDGIATGATKTAKSSTNGNILINGTETTVYTHPSGTNPHGTTKSDVGLGNVGNFKAVSTVSSQGLTDTEKSNARTNIGAGTSNFSGNYNDLTNKPTIATTSANGLMSSTDKVTLNALQECLADIGSLTPEISGDSYNLRINSRLYGELLFLDATTTQSCIDESLKPYVKKTDVSNVYKYKGSVSTVADLPSTGNSVGDTYNVNASDMNYSWNGTAWDALGGTFTIEYLTNAEIDNLTK